MVTAPGAVGAAITMPWAAVAGAEEHAALDHSMRAFMGIPWACRGSARLVAEQVEEDAGVIIARGDVQAVAFLDLDRLRNEVIACFQWLVRLRLSER